MPLRWYAPGADPAVLENTALFDSIDGTIISVIISYGLVKKTAHFKLKDEEGRIYNIEIDSQNDFEDIYQLTGVRDLRPLRSRNIRIYLRKDTGAYHTFTIDEEKPCPITE